MPIDLDALTACKKEKWCSGLGCQLIIPSVRDLLASVVVQDDSGCLSLSVTSTDTTTPATVDLDSIGCAGTTATVTVKDEPATQVFIKGQASPIPVCIEGATPELDAIVANWLPICVDGVQWYAREREIIDNTDGSSTSVVIEYKQGVGGAITTTAPTGTITDGYCQANSALVKTYDWELTCLTNDGGATVEQGVVAFDMSDPQNPTETLYLNGVDVTGTYTRTDCTQATQDRELVTNCYQDITDPTIRYQRVDVIDVASTPATVLETIWFDSTGAVITEPSNIQLCGDIPSRQALPHQVGCIVTEASCAVGTNTVSFTAGEYTQFTITANDGNGNYTVVQEMSTVAGATNLVTVLTEASQANARTEQQIVGTATFNYWSGNFSNISQPTTTSVQLDMHLEAGITDTPPVLDTPCVDPVSDSTYQTSAATLRTAYDGIPVGVAQPQSTDSIIFAINTYDAVPANTTQVKQIVWEDVDGTLIEEYRQVGDINSIVPFDPNTQKFVPNCLDDTVDTIVECAGATTVTDTFDSSRYDFTDVVEPLAGYPTYNFEDFSTNTPSGLVIDGNYAELVVQDGLTISASIQDGSQLTNFVDFLGNGTGADSGPTLDLGTDPTGASFISSFIADTLVALSDFGLTAPTQVNVRSSSVGGGSLQFTIDFFGTEGITQANYLNYFTTSLNGNQWQSYFYGLNPDYEFNSTFDPIVIPGNPTAITATFNLDIPTGADTALGLNIGGIFGDQAQPYVFVNGNGVPTEYTYTFAITGTDPISGAYSITGADLAIPDNIHAWVYFESSSPGTTYRVDGVRLSVTYDTIGGSQPANLVALCDTQLKEITDRLDLLANDTGGGTQLLTRFQSDTTDNIYSFVPSAPSGTKTIYVTNDSSYYIRIGTNIGDIVVAPGRIGTMSVEDTEPDIVINYLSDVGGYTPGERVVFNFERRL